MSRCEDEQMWEKMWEKMWRWADVREDVKMSRCERRCERRCEDEQMWEKMWRWADVREDVREDVKMSRCERKCEDEKMFRRCEDEKMFYRPPLLEEPCAQTLSGIIVIYIWKFLLKTAWNRCVVKSLFQSVVLHFTSWHKLWCCIKTAFRFSSLARWMVVKVWNIRSTTMRLSLARTATTASSLLAQGNFGSEYETPWIWMDGGKPFFNGHATGTDWLEVPTIYKAYIRPKFQRISPPNIAKNMVQ